MIKHVHVNECDSTQDVLKEQLKAAAHENLLVSCENQTSGRGRGENIWRAMPGTLCLSLNIKPHIVMSYTALEISVIVAMFFESKGCELKLKWPNDLWDQDYKKCGGILVQGHQGQLLAGIGVNLFSTSAEYGGVFPEAFKVDKRLWSQELAQYIHDHRFQETATLRTEWLKRCGHLNQMVRMTEGSDAFEGIFQGLGEHGEAEVCCDGKISKFYNGSLRIIS